MTSTPFADLLAGRANVYVPTVFADSCRHPHNSLAVRRVNDGERIEGSRDAYTSDEVRSINANEDATNRDAEVEKDRTVPGTNVEFRALNIDRAAALKRHNLHLLAEPIDEWNISLVAHRLVKVLEDLSNMSERLAWLDVFLSDCVGGEIAEALQKHGVYQIELNGYLTRFLDELYEDLPRIISTINATNRQLAVSVETLSDFATHTHSLPCHDERNEK
ncbi:hypothetical protein [Schaalia sp. ZJ1691]|uniref:hypothetical protein n=1 Tax=Schaalia sp. ZJ1691 TaxID=2709404 RepID=UPI0013EC9272|nr:hypothetical protein [Schaalia sp. ZJ1691]